MIDNLMNLLRAAEIGAICASKLIGQKDKDGIDKLAVDAINLILTNSKFPGEVVLGEGELDEAPMLYVGQKFNEKVMYDIAVDPVEGTTPASENQPGAITTLATSKKGSMINIPEMYMEKLFINPSLSKYANLKKDIKEHVQEFKKHKQDLKAIILNKPRHKEMIKWFMSQSVEVKLINDGDVMGAIDVVNGAADFLWGIGGSPEGGLMAALAIASSSEMIWSLAKFDEVKGSKMISEKRGKEEAKKIQELGLKFHEPKLAINLLNDTSAAFVASAITSSDSLEKASNSEMNFIVHSIYARAGTVRTMKSTHNKKALFKKYPQVKEIFE